MDIVEYVKEKGSIKKGQACCSAPLNRFIFASFRTWSVRQELVVQGLPAAKLEKDGKW